MTESAVALMRVCQRRSKIRQFRRLKIRQLDERTSLRSSRPPDERGGAAWEPGPDLVVDARLPQVRVLPHAIAIAADRYDVAVVDEPIDERRRHDVVAKDRPPLFKLDVRTVDACS